MDEIARNKAVVAELFARSEAGEDIFPLLADDVQWFVPGKWKLGGTYRKDELAPVFDKVLGSLAYPPRFTIFSMTAEADRVAVHAESQSEFTDGEPFGNTYHFLFHLRDGLIIKTMEYLDTHYMNELVTRRADINA